jgi:hypothetical protein
MKRVTETFILIIIVRSNQKVQTCWENLQSVVDGESSASLSVPILSMKRDQYG